MNKRKVPVWNTYVYRTLGTFKFSKCISKITPFKNPNKVQRALREFASAKVEQK
uniref:Uncharacterized protein n=1 Tax=viral metagenome TaxID=1070528 RepID=A0A6M3JHM0_9ZZZZ